jgi:hypothetical protein
MRAVGSEHKGEVKMTAQKKTGRKSSRRRPFTSVTAAGLKLI